MANGWPCRFLTIPDFPTLYQISKIFTVIAESQASMIKEITLWRFLKNTASVQGKQL